MIFASIWLILGVIRVKLESGNATRVRKLTQLTRVTRLELQALVGNKKWIYGDVGNHKIICGVSVDQMLWWGGC